MTGSRKTAAKTGTKNVGERDVWRDCASLVPPFVLLLLFNESRIYLNENQKQWATASRKARCFPIFCNLPAARAAPDRKTKTLAAGR